MPDDSDNRPAARPIRIGDTAPDFIARSTAGPVRLSDYRGRWLLFFSHPGDFTPVCTSEFLAIARAADRFAELDCALLAHSIDSLFSHLAWIRALRDDETAAVAAGINPLLTRAVLFSLCGGMLAVIGALDTLQKLRISPAGSFSLQDWTVMIIFVVVIGGLGTVSGPIVGAIAFVVFRETLSDFGPLYLAAMGVLAIGVMLFEPRGLVVILARTVKSLRARRNGLAGGA